MIPSRHRNGALFGLLALVWGTSFAAIETGLAVFPPVLFAAFRYDVASVVMLAYAASLGFRRAEFGWRPATRSDWSMILVGGSLVFGLHYALLFVGQGYVTSGVAAVVMSLIPVVTPLFALALLSDERLDALEGVGVLLGLVGVTVIAQPDPGSLGETAVGVGLLFLSAVSFALGTVLTQRVRTTLPTVALQAWMMVVGSVVLHAISLLRTGVPTDLSPGPSALFALGYLSLAASVGGFLIYFDLLDRLGPNEISLVNYVVPVVATLTGWLLLGEPITRETVTGFLVIVVGFALLKWSSLKRSVVRVTRPSRTLPGATSSETVVVSGNVYYRR